MSRPVSKPLTAKQSKNLLAQAAALKAASTEQAQKTALVIVERIASGETLRSISKEDGMPSAATFLRWAHDNNALGKAYLAARELSATLLEEEALDLGRELIDIVDSVNAPAVAAFNAAMNQLRWSASKRDPGSFGDKQTVNVRVPISINTTLNLGADGEQSGGSNIPDVYTIDLEAVPELEFQPPEKKDEKDH